MPIVNDFGDVVPVKIIKVQSRLPKIKTICTINMNTDYSVQQAQYITDGYCIFQNHLTLEDCQVLTHTAIDSLFRVAFHDEPHVPASTIENLELFNNKGLREAHLTNPNCIYKNNNTRTPFCSKSGGGIVHHGKYLPEVQKRFTMTKSTYDKVLACYKTYPKTDSNSITNIAQIFGPENYSIKYNGSEDMPKHLDSNFIFDNEQISLERVQTLVVTSIDSIGVINGTLSLRDSGTIAIIPRFHLYRFHAAIFFDPETGDKPLKVGIERFMVLKGLGRDSGFDEALPSFNTLLSELHQIKIGALSPQTHHRRYLYLPLPELNKANNTDDNVMFVPLVWTPIAMNPGDMFCWNQWLPHQNLRCKSKIPRIVFYVRYYPVANWYVGSEAHKLLIATLEKGDYIDESNKYDKVKDNSLERKILHGNNQNRYIGKPYYYVPEDSSQRAFTDYIQCLKM